MIALVAAIIIFLHGIGVIDNTEDINWLYVGLAFWALHFAVTLAIPLGRFDRK